MTRFADWIDRTNRVLGTAVAWLCFAMILLGAANAIARYAGRFVGLNLASNAYIEAQWYLFSVVFLLGAAATLERDGHVRVDVLYSRLSARGRDWIDFVGAFVFLIPFCVFAIAVSWPAVQASWQILEGSPDPGGLPRYPLKSLILVAFALLLAQGVSGAIRSGARLFAGAPPLAPHGHDEGSGRA